jgi:hypothetical protein
VASSPVVRRAGKAAIKAVVHVGISKILLAAAGTVLAGPPGTVIGGLLGTAVDVATDVVSNHG